MSKEIEKAQKLLKACEANVEKTVTKIEAVKESLVELREQIKVDRADMRDAKRAARLLESVANRENKKAERASESAALKERLKQINEEATAARKAAREAIRAEKAEATAALAQPVRNGVKHPKADTVAGDAWAMFDELSQKAKAPVELAEAVTIGTENGLKAAKIKSEHKLWLSYWI